MDTAVYKQDFYVLCLAKFSMDLISTAITNDLCGLITKLTFTCSKSTIDTLEKGERYAQS